MIDLLAAGFEVIVILVSLAWIVTAILSSGFGQSGAECFLLVIVGVAIIYVAIHFGPITMSMGGKP